MDSITYKKGNIIKFKDMRKYEVLNVYPLGYLVTEKTDFPKLMGAVHFFPKEFVDEAHRKKYIIPDRKEEVKSNKE
jgi:hypothetical protein